MNELDCQHFLFIQILWIKVLSPSLNVLPGGFQPTGVLIKAITLVFKALVYSESHTILLWFNYQPCRQKTAIELKLGSQWVLRNYPVNVQLLRSLAPKLSSQVWRVTVPCTTQWVLGGKPCNTRISTRLLRTVRNRNQATEALPINRLRIKVSSA